MSVAQSHHLVRLGTETYYYKEMSTDVIRLSLDADISEESYLDSPLSFRPQNGTVALDLTPSSEVSLLAYIMPIIPSGLECCSQGLPT